MDVKSGYKTKKLVCVTLDNNNKYYDMQQLNSSEWEATWGRVGVTSSKKIYSMNEWESKYREKLKKGYKDQTELFVVASNKRDFIGIKDSSIALIVRDLQSFANKSVAANYTVTTDQVTQKQIDTAQLILNELSSLVKNDSSTSRFNDCLIKLWTTVPRRIANTREAVLQFGTFNSPDKFDFTNKLLVEEQSSLDIMRGQVNVSNVQKNQDDSSDLNILDAMGIKFSLADDDDVKVIKSKLGEIKDKFTSAWKIVNNRTQEKFNNFVSTVSNKKTELFWHGSRNENWWSIIDSGLMIRPSSAVYTGSMYGDGIYGASLSRKSYGYTSAKGSYWAKGSSSRCFMSLFDFHVGNQLLIHKHSSWCYDLNWNVLRKKGDFHSAYGVKGADLRNDEFIVYKPDQVTIKYLVELMG